MNSFISLIHIAGAVLSTIFFMVASFFIVKKYQKKRRNIYKSTQKKDLLKIANKIKLRLRHNSQNFSKQEISKIEKDINKCVHNLNFKKLLTIYCIFFPQEESYIKRYYLR